MCSVTVPDFSTAEACGDNLPGVADVYVIKSDDLVRPLPAVTASTRTIATDFTFNASATYKQWKFLSENAVHEENANDSGTFDTILRLIFPKDSEAKRYNFTEMQNSCCLYSLIYTDENGETKFIDKVRFRRTYTTGQGESTDRNAYTVEFYKTGEAAYKYTGAITLPA